jgi:hypothetical protein
MPECAPIKVGRNRMTGANCIMATAAQTFKPATHAEKQARTSSGDGISRSPRIDRKTDKARAERAATIGSVAAAAAMALRSGADGRAPSVSRTRTIASRSRVALATAMSTIAAADCGLRWHRCSRIRAARAMGIDPLAATAASRAALLTAPPVCPLSDLQRTMPRETGGRGGGRRCPAPAGSGIAATRGRAGPRIIVGFRTRTEPLGGRPTQWLVCSIPESPTGPDTAISTECGAFLAPLGRPTLLRRFPCCSSGAEIASAVLVWPDSCE